MKKIQKKKTNRNTSKASQVVKPNKITLTVTECFWAAESDSSSAEGVARPSRSMPSLTCTAFWTVDSYEETVHLISCTWPPKSCFSSPKPPELPKSNINLPHL